MDGHAMPPIDEFPLFDETNYLAWRIKIKGYLKSTGVGFWDTIVVGSVPFEETVKICSSKGSKEDQCIGIQDYLQWNLRFCQRKHRTMYLRQGPMAEAREGTSRKNTRHIRQ
jgi:hypothetical protein